MGAQVRRARSLHTVSVSRAKDPGRQEHKAPNPAGNAG